MSLNEISLSKNKNIYIVGYCVCVFRMCFLVNMLTIVYHALVNVGPLYFCNMPSFRLGEINHPQYTFQFGFNYISTMSIHV